MPQLLETWLHEFGLSAPLVATASNLIALFVFILLAIIAYWVDRRRLAPFLASRASKSTTDWDKIMAREGVFHWLSHLLPVSVLYFTIDIFFPGTEGFGEVLRRLMLVAYVLVGLRIMDALLRSTSLIVSSKPLAKGKPIKGYTQALAIVAYVVAGVFIISILTAKSPWGLLTLMGGITAVVLLVFKDTILGFVASIQLAAHDMVRIGDWIEMPKYDANGDVIDVNIHTVKVQNFDRTFSNVPTYALISDSFINWRGMMESGGRRIKRSLYIDMNSIRFCTPEMLERFAEIELLQDYITAKEEEIRAYNASHIKQHPEQWVNGRHQTNIGVFRAYVSNYLRRHPLIHQDMTFLVRHLQPTPQGLPLEIYVFSKKQDWADYEGIQADIFDHLLAALPHFDLRLFQEPSGFDWRMGGTTGGRKELPAADQQAQL